MDAELPETSRPSNWNCTPMGKENAELNSIYSVEVWPQSEEEQQEATPSSSAQWGIECIFSHTKQYPETAPLVHVTSIRGLSKQQVEDCCVTVKDTIEENMGIPMMYTVIMVVQEWLNALEMESKEAARADDPAVLEQQRRQEEEARIAALRAHGHEVTPESFAKWKKKFEEEMTPSTVDVTAPSGPGRVTGKQWFLQQQSSNGAAAAAEDDVAEYDDEVLYESSDDDHGVFSTSSDDDELLDQLEDNLVLADSD
jgi:hypothetical protein